MIEEPEESEAFLKELLQGSILKTPSRDFTTQLMTQVAQQNKFKVEMKHRFFQQTLMLSITAFISVLVCIYLGLTYFNFSINFQIPNSIFTNILTVSQNIVSSITGGYYLVIPIVLLWLLDRLYLNIRFSDQK